MKKLLIILFSATFYVSCTQVHSVEPEKSSCPYTNIEGTDIMIEKINYSGHSYILVVSSQINGSGVSLVHDPDCPCGTNRK